MGKLPYLQTSFQSAMCYLQ